MNSNNNNLNEKLINNSYEDQFFSIQSKQLTSLFDASKIHKGVSLQSVLQLGKIEGILSKLSVDKSVGLKSRATDDLDRRRKQFGDNIPEEQEPTSIWDLVTEQFEDRTLQILCAAAAASLIMGISQHGFLHGSLDGMGIVFAISVIVTVTAVNNYKKDQQFRNLFKQTKTRNVQCLRDSKIQSINQNDLLVGDIMIFEIGEIFSVDGILLEGANLSIDESDMTGESDPIKKKVPKDYAQDEKCNPFIISGTKVMEGSGKLLVCAVGENSVQGQMRKILQDSDDLTPLQEKLTVMADDIGYMGMLAAGLTFLAMTLHLLIEKYNNDDEIMSMKTLSQLLDFFMLAVSVVVCAVPEGLPLAVTIALAYSVGKMYEENNLVRHLSACETMGNVNNICSDKTGTLTMNKMTVSQLYTEDCIHSKIQKQNFTPKVKEFLCDGISYNSNANPVQGPNGFEHIGNKTECALLQMVNEQFNENYVKIRNSGMIQKIFPFDYKSKSMMTVVKIPDSDKYRMYVKGAPEYLMSSCQSYISENGQIIVLSEDKKFKIMENVVSSFAKQSLRTILLASSDINHQQFQDLIDASSSQEYLHHLTLNAIAGIKDPLRPGIPEAVQQCKESGIMVRMVTGDNLETAIAISKDAGIIPRYYEYSENCNIVMQGLDFYNAVGGLIPADKQNGTPARVGDLEKFQQISKNLRVLSRSNPDHKYLLVTGLKQLQNVVAVTGDGTNDAPALKKADIGFAMGIAGTEVAKESAGIILLDDNFVSIITALKWGRNIFDSIRKFLQFQLTVNVVAVFMVFFSGVILRESPLSVIQMLWVNMIMDTLASLALATEPPHESLLKRKPYPRDEYMVTPFMWRNVICQSIFQIITLVIILFWGNEIFDVQTSRHMDPWNKDQAVHYTIFFNIFIFMQLFNEINSRKLSKEQVNVFEGFFNNPLFLFVIIFTAVVQILLVSYGGQLFKCAPLTFNQHLACLLIGSLSLIVGVIIKMIPEEIFNKIPLFTQLDIDQNQRQQSFTQMVRGNKSKSDINRSKNSFQKGLKYIN